MRRAVGIVPVAHRDAVGGLVHEVVHRGDELLEGGLVGRHGGRPYDPVRLGVVAAAVQRQAVAILLGEVVGDLGGGDVVVEDVVPEHLVPDEIIFLAPRVALVERKAVVVTRRGHLLPCGGHVACGVGVLLRHVCLACHAGDVAIGGYTHDSLDREVGVTRPVSGEVVRAELVGGIQTVLHKVVGPCRQGIPMLERILGASLHLADRSREDQHVAALLDRHVAAVGLAVGQGVGDDIVCREGFGPLAALGVVEYEVEQGLRQLGVVVEEQRRRGVGDIDRTDRAVAEVLLREPCQLALRRLDEFVCGDSLTVGQSAEFGILFSAGGVCLLHKLGVERGAALHERLVILGCGGELLGYRAVAVAVPVGADVLTEILYRIDVVVADHDISRLALSADGAQRCGDGHTVALAAALDGAAVGKLAAHGYGVAHRAA